MKLSEYFEKTKGYGVLATADSKGLVDAAIYSKPHFIDEERIAFIMADRLTHKNLQFNPHAIYLFIESGGGYNGRRLFLTKTDETDDAQVVDSLLRNKEYKNAAKFVVYFRIDKAIPLIGDGDIL